MTGKVLGIVLVVALGCGMFHSTSSLAETPAEQASRLEADCLSGPDCAKAFANATEKERADSRELWKSEVYSLENIAKARAIIDQLHRACEQSLDPRCQALNKARGK
jgi:hypothetical protein